MKAWLGFRYAKAGAGQSLHIVAERGDDVSLRALCGYQPARDHWWIVTNQVVGSDRACQTCQRTINAQYRRAQRDI
jgi:hypothetical protein